MSAALETRRLSLLVHGEAGTGKSRLLDTAPGPRLLLDAEGGAADWTPSPKAYWDPAGPLPEAQDGVKPFDRQGGPITTDTTVVVIVQDWTTVEQAYRVLASGQHYFESALWDSVTEIQDKCKRAISAANGGMQQAGWGDLLDRMAEAIKEWRDLRLPPSTRPIHTFFTAISNDVGGKRWKADVQGALVRKLPGWVDTVGYLTTQGAPDGKSIIRLMAIQPLGDYDAKDRTDLLTSHYGNFIVNPNLLEMVAVLSAHNG